MSEMVLTREGFRRWLSALEPQTVVGEHGSIWCCPLARFLQASSSADAVVGCSTFRSERLGSGWRTLPPWALQFRRKVDAMGRGTSTAADCLRLLTTIPEDSTL